ncbi:MAG TPA: GNAT family N-acetyltransferase [Nocardioides sp.]|nr:GNAT family N-acetyltransferase [Nocardioides sp.]
MRPDLQLRPATADDAARVAEVHLRARAAAPMPPSVHADDRVRTWLASRVAGAGGDEVWVAESGGRVVGYARFTRTWLDDLYVDPDHARQGIGSALLDVVKARHPGGFGLWVFVSNQPALAFYVRHGLVERERTDGSANAERAPDVRMEWTG